MESKQNTSEDRSWSKVNMDEISKFLNSEEGQKAIDKAQKDSEEIGKIIDSMTHLTRAQLDEPFTI